MMDLLSLQCQWLFMVCTSESFYLNAIFNCHISSIIIIILKNECIYLTNKPVQEEIVHLKFKFLLTPDVKEHIRASFHSQNGIDDTKVLSTVIWYGRHNCQILFTNNDPAICFKSLKNVIPYSPPSNIRLGVTLSRAPE